MFVLGLALRAREWLARRSLWLDEALLAENIVGRGFGELVRPLANDQAAPIGFLWLTRALYVALGHDERILRLVPFVAGVLVPVLAGLVARRVAGPRSALVAVALTSLCPALIRYSNELKQYSLDACIALALVAVLLPLFDGASTRAATPATTAAAAAAGAAALWFSHPAALVLASSGALIAVRRLRTDPRTVVALGATWSASFAALYVVNLRASADNDALKAYWAGGFPESPTAVPGWLVGRVVDFFDEPVGLALPAMGALLALVAVVRERWTAAFLCAPLVPLVAVAAAELYPFEGRLTLYAVPLVLCAMALLVRRHPAVWGVAIAVVALPYASSVQLFVEPTRFAEVRPLFEQIAPLMRPGDAVWAHDSTLHVARFYADELPVSAIEVLVPGECTTTTVTSDRIWYVYGYRLSTRRADEERFYREALAAFGPTTVFRTHGASATLIEVRDRTAPLCATVA